MSVIHLSRDCVHLFSNAEGAAWENVFGRLREERKERKDKLEKGFAFSEYGAYVYRRTVHNSQLTSPVCRASREKRVLSWMQRRNNFLNQKYDKFNKAMWRFLWAFSYLMDWLYLLFRLIVIREYVITYSYNAITKYLLIDFLTNLHRSSHTYVLIMNYLSHFRGKHFCKRNVSHLFEKTKKLPFVTTP